MSYKKEQLSRSELTMVYVIYNLEKLRSWGLVPPDWGRGIVLLEKSRAVLEEMERDGFSPTTTELDEAFGELEHNGMLQEPTNN